MAVLNLTSGNTTVSVIAGDLANSALTELDVVGGGEVANGNDLALGLETLQRRIDLINAQRQMIYAETFPVFTLLTNTQPISIGPTGQFVLPSPPVEIRDWSLILAGGGGVEIPGEVLTESQWAAVAIKNLTSTLCTALYYERQFPNGNLYFWPIPTQANQVRLRIWQNLPQALTANTSLALPPAYWAYLHCSLASDLAVPFGEAAIARVGSEPFKLRYREAREAIVDNNVSAPPLYTDVPSSGRHDSVVPDFDFLTGFRR